MCALVTGVQTCALPIWLLSGDIVEAVAEMEEDTRLLVIGKRGEAADFAKLHLGSNLERVVRTSRRPILVASRAFRPIERFLIAFDGGPSAVKAVEHIAGGSLLRGLQCHQMGRASCRERVCQYV